MTEIDAIQAVTEEMVYLKVFHPSVSFDGWVPKSKLAKFAEFLHECVDEQLPVPESQVRCWNRKRPIRRKADKFDLDAAVNKVKTAMQ